MKDEMNTLKTEGTKIDWKIEDPTKKIVNIKKKNKKTGKTKLLEKTVRGESIFCFFNSYDFSDEALKKLDEEDYK